MSWILTYSGTRFELIMPTGAMVKPQDIAHALARLCRFNGHTREHYSVAQHSLLVAELVPAEHKLQALLHDATEAYVGDMTRPLKQLMPEFQYAERRVWLAICEAFHIEPELHPSIHHADMLALGMERRDLMPAHPEPWECLAGLELPAQTITPWPAEKARYAYFQQLMELLTTTHRTHHQH